MFAPLTQISGFRIGAQPALHLSGMTDVSSRLPSRPSAAQSRDQNSVWQKAPAQGQGGKR
ncbi:hypothetical protein [Roseibium sp. MMSF_3412]|uniref:hypothetical protein n=1 Tax=Roseibium sp. MMSF_3412 TaxID=3046712 RepID=UPI00273DAE2B|nr:hypothetical protein [Roseibium sp. MMSF_3412]